MNPAKQARRLLKLADKIEARPDNFEMAAWMKLDGGGQQPGNVRQLRALAEQRQAADVGDFLSDAASSCGTTACIGGWATILWPPTKPEDRDASIEDYAARVLGYARPDGSVNWPELDGLFDSSAEWQDANEAATELRRRAAVILSEAYG